MTSRCRLPEAGTIGGITLTALLLSLPLHAQTPALLGLGDHQWVGRDEVCRAMVEERAKGYDLTASTNGTRLWVHTARRLVEWARERAPDGPPLFIPQEEYFQGYLCAAGLEVPAAPEFIRIAYEFGQHTLVEYRTDRVVDPDLTTDRPHMALAVKTWWPPEEGKPDEYTFVDTLSDPHLLAVNKREVRYRILDYGDQFLVDDVSGVRGRPTSGILGLLFKVIGTGSVEWSRMAISDAGEQVIRARAKKLIGKTSVVTVTPDGRGGTIPDERPDLKALAQQLERELDVAYLPWPF